jgi:hypothetical protein
MAKKKPAKKSSSRRRPADDDEELEATPPVEDGDIVDDDDEDSEEEDDGDATASAQPKDFFSSLKEGFKAAGETAERFARMGITVGHLEKLKLELKVAYSRLGEHVNKCWDAAPDIGVTATDPAIAAQVKVVNDLRRKIREIEVRLRELKKG